MLMAAQSNLQMSRSRPPKISDEIAQVLARLSSLFKSNVRWHYAQ